MALHGYVNLAAVPFNAEEDVETAFLQCLEAGALPNFRITAKDNTVLKDTGLRLFVQHRLCGGRREAGGDAESLGRPV